MKFDHATKRATLTLRFKLAGCRGDSIFAVGWSGERTSVPMSGAGGLYGCIGERLRTCTPRLPIKDRDVVGEVDVARFVYEGSYDRSDGEVSRFRFETTCVRVAPGVERCTEG